MARSQRRIRSSEIKHLARKPVPHGIDVESGRQKYIVKPVCGSDKRIYQFTFDPDFKPGYSDGHFTNDVTSHFICGACQSKALSAKFKEDAASMRFTLGERVDLGGTYDEKKNKPYGINAWNWKSVYPVFDSEITSENDEDKVIAFIAIANGFGQAWEIRGWESDYNTRYHDKRQPPKMSGSCAYWNRAAYQKDQPPFKSEAKGISSKEVALLMIHEMVIDGFLKSRQQIIALEDKMAEVQAVKDEERRIEQEERNRIRAELAADRAARKNHIATAFIEMLYEGKVSNYQREALFEAAKFLEINIQAKPVLVETDDDDGFELR